MLSVRHAQEQIGEVFSEHLVRCSRSAFAVASGVLGDFDAAEEAVQEAAYRAWRAASSFDPARPFQPWFLRIVRNTAVSELQRRARFAPLSTELHDREPTPAEIVVARERAGETVAALKTLPHAYRRAVILRAVHGLDYRRIAQVLGVPSATARIHVHRARLRLRGR